MNELTPEIKNEIIKISDYHVTITDQKSYEEAGSLLNNIKKTSKTITDFFKDMKAAAAAAHKNICAKEKKELAPLLDAETRIKGAMAAFYTMERHRIHKEEERKRKEAESLLSMAQEAELCGDEAFASEIIAVASAQSTNITSTPSASGISTRTIWKYRVTDFEMVPRQYLELNTAMLNAIARTIKDNTQNHIPGIEFYSETIIAGSAK